MLRAHARALIVTASGAELITLLSGYSRGKQAESVCVCVYTRFFIPTFIKLFSVLDLRTYFFKARLRSLQTVHFETIIHVVLKKLETTNLTVMCATK